MNNHFAKKALSAVCAVVLLAAAVMTLFPGALAEQYRTGDAEISAAVRNLDINWTSGKVNIAYHSGNNILISEKTSGFISGDMRMRWRVDGDTLRIEYNQPGFHLFSILPHEKELTVILPDGLTLTEANISTTSADMSIPALYADRVKIKSTSGDVRAAVNARSIQSKLTSGDIELQVMHAAEEITIESTSGDITLIAAGTKDKTAIDTTSGTIHAAVKQTKEFKAKSTSGDIQAVIGSAQKTEVKSVSGKVTVEIADMEALDIHTTSGDVTAYLPAAPGFTARFQSTSGRITHQLPLTKQGKDDIAGDGSGSVKIHTTSGNITVCANES